MQTIQFRAMNCHMTATVDSRTPKAGRLLAQAPQWFAIWEDCLSRFRPQSELSRLNRCPGQDVAVSALLEDVLRAALASAEASGGLVTPTVLEALLEAGYTGSFETLPVGGAPAVLDTPLPARPVLPASAICLDEQAHTVRLTPGARLDLGGIAKGWAADQAARLLAQAGPALVDAGGDLAASEPQANGDPWAITVSDPSDPTRELALALLYQGGIATSGRDYRRWQKDGRWQHHLIDPRTGRPAQTRILQATVIAPSAQAAEMAAKTAFLMGEAAGLAWLDQRPDLAGLLALEDGTCLPSRSWNDHIWKEEA